MKKLYNIIAILKHQRSCNENFLFPFDSRNFVCRILENISHAKLHVRTPGKYVHFYLKSPVSLDFSVEKKKCLKITIVTQIEIPHLFSSPSRRN